MADEARRGRPRDAAARRKVLAAARKLLERGGLPAVTIEAVALVAGVSRPTIYRSWPNAQAVAMAALMAAPESAAAQPAAQPAAADRAGALDALRRHLHGVVAAVATRAGRSAAALVAAADSDSELAKAFRHSVILKSRSEGRALLERAVADGAVRADIDMETALDLLYAPLFFRLLLGHQPLDAAFADALLAQALAGLGRR
ncbi:MAG: TetR/AcrR family transcriptional regulator [Alphaproteobacteria bacterium]|nr:TetR/AcrR family transcriptional regulator [Alphaproteobacteria bacterium]